ncbi:hypothetical protein KJ570_01070 [Patescibacteria group bacterium]|nr:hypothetical protein [Patescibacteria group bacterium]MBU2036542.1 hypothetical protein [Patescibacteria group bacterium]
MGQVIFPNFPTWGIAKGFILFGIAMYVVFGFVVVRQVKLMTNTLQLGYEAIAKTLSYLHLMFTIAVFIFALLIL